CLHDRKPPPLHAGAIPAKRSRRIHGDPARAREYDARERWYPPPDYNQQSLHRVNPPPPHCPIHLPHLLSATLLYLTEIPWAQPDRAAPIPYFSWRVRLHRYCLDERCSLVRCEYLERNRRSWAGLIGNKEYCDK